MKDDLSDVVSSLVKRALPLGLIGLVLGALTQLKSYVEGLGWLLVTTVCIAACFSWVVYVFRSKTTSKFDPGHKVLRYSTTDRGIAIFGAVAMLFALVAVSWLWKSPRTQSGEYSVALDSTECPFESSVISSFDSPFVKSSETNRSARIQYFSRDRRLPLVTLSSCRLIRESIHDASDLNTLKKDEILFEGEDHDIQFEMLRTIGKVLNELKGGSVFKTEPYTKCLPSTLTSHEGLAVWFLSWLYPSPTDVDAQQFANQLAMQTEKALREKTESIPAEASELIRSILTRKLSPVLLLTLSNYSSKPVVVSTIKVKAERLTGSAGGVESGPLVPMADVAIQIKGTADETVEQRLKIPVQIVANDSVTIRVAVNCKEMFSYKITLTVASDNSNICTFDPFVIDYY